MDIIKKLVLVVTCASCITLTGCFGTTSIESKGVASYAEILDPDSPDFIE